MPATDLNPFSYVVMALVGRGGAGPHDIVDMMRRGGRLHWTAAPSKIYAEPKRLAGLGYLHAERVPGRTGERTLYTLTARGERALRDWVAQPSVFPRIQSEAVVRMLAGDIGDRDALVGSLTAMRAELDELDALLDASDARAADLPHRERHLRLIGSLGRRLVDAHRAWLDDVEAELGTPAG